MTVDFQQNGTRFQLLVSGIGLREREALTADIRPDPTLWHSEARKLKDCSGLRGPEEVQEGRKAAIRKGKAAWRRFQVGRGVKK